MNYLIMMLVIVGFINLFIYFVNGHVGDSKQPDRVFLSTLTPFEAIFHGSLRIIK